MLSGGYVLDHVTLDELVGALASLVELARKEGILSLERGIETYQNEVLCEGLRICMDMMSGENTALLLRAYMTAWTVKEDLHFHLLRIVGHEIIQGHTLAAVEPRLRRLVENM